MSDPKPAQFRKTKTGKWAVMAPVVTLEKALQDDAGVVQVLKKSGDYSTFTVGSLGKPFDVDGIQMCYGYSPEDSEAPKPSRTPSSEWPADSDVNEHYQEPVAIDLDEPPRDTAEPLPDYQGDSGDEWDGGF